MAKSMSITQAGLSSPSDVSAAAAIAIATATIAAASSSSTTTSQDMEDSGAKALALSKLICQDLIFMEKALEEVQKYVDHAKVQVDVAREKLKELEPRGSEKDLRVLKKKVAKLKSKLPLNLKIHSTNDADSNPHRNPLWSDVVINDLLSNPTSIIGGLMHSLFVDVNPYSHHTHDLEKFKVSFDTLDTVLRNCLFCFLKFPEGATIKKRIMIYWWIGEGILAPTPTTTTQDNSTTMNRRKSAEDIGEELLNELIKKAFIEPVYLKPGLVADSCKMPPAVRSILTTLAEKDGFSTASTSTPAPEKVQYQLNVNSYFVGDNPETFQMMKNIEILYLGSWQGLAAAKAEAWAPHIEIVGTKFLDGLKNMKQLRFLSLQGISLITKLPRFNSDLTNLTILDLRGCHNLEVIPDEIRYLKNLTHLDMSDCYLLEHMPWSLGRLKRLQVLKGFFIGSSTYEWLSCTLGGLMELSELKKLNIYTKVKEFPTEEDLRVLQNFKALKKLTISWGGCSLGGHSKPSEFLQPKKYALPSWMQKVDLRGFPKKTLPDWLMPKRATNLEKLYIRGGMLCNLDTFQAPWTVKVLRLKYLFELKMDWIDLRRSFPKLVYMEKVECPKLTGFPNDATGVWSEQIERAAVPISFNPFEVLDSQTDSSNIFFIFTFCVLFWLFFHMCIKLIMYK